MSRSKLCHFAAKLCVALFLSVKMGRRLVSPALGVPFAYVGFCRGGYAIRQPASELQGFAILSFYGSLDNGPTPIVATVLSVFGALLFNVLMLVYDALAKTDPGQRRRRFLEHLASNISFAILVALVTIVSVLVGIFVKDSASAAATFHGFTYFLLTMFLLTLAMILKRTQILLVSQS